MMATSDEDPVGYGRPPKKHQFKPGQSGNPKGRPKGSRSIAKILEEELDQKVSVTDNDKRLRLSKRQLAIRQQVDKAAKGNLPAFRALLQLIAEEERNRDEALRADPVQTTSQTELSDDQYEAALTAFLVARNGKYAT